MKKILFISRHTPYGSNFAREALDAALTGAAYDQRIALLFMDDGVFQLLENQNTQSNAQKNISKTLNALALYGLEDIYVHQGSLHARNITDAQLILNEIQLLNDDDCKKLLTKQDLLLSF